MRVVAVAGQTLSVAMLVTMWCGALALSMKHRQATDTVLYHSLESLPHLRSVTNSEYQLSRRHSFANMLDYIKYKKAKKHQDQSAEHKSPVLSPTDEQFLQQIVAEEETPPPLPERHPEHVADDPARGLTGEAEQAVLAGDRGIKPEEAVLKGKESEDKGTAKKENKAWSFLHKSFSKKDKKKAPEVQTDGSITPNEGRYNLLA
jgi:hypothetical protein